MAAWYRHWFNSAYYHKLYFQRNEAEANAFIDKLIAYLKPAPGSRMVDVACGRGRHSRMLAAAGFDVTGFDLAAANIAYAQQYEQDNLHFFVHDMRLPFWINYFDYAFNFFTSFGYFDTRREHDNAVRAIGQSLKPGGIVVIDYLNAHYAEAHLQHNAVVEIDGTAYEIHRWHNASHFYKRILISDAALEQPLEVTEKVAKFSLGDFVEMLAYQNIQVTEVFGNYNLQPYDVHQTPRIIVVAKKK